MSLGLKEMCLKRWGVAENRVIPRLPELRALHGVPIVRYTVAPEVPEWFIDMVTYTGVAYDSETGLITKSNGHKLKATKWLSAVGVGEKKLNEFARSGDPKTFDLVLSTSYKDIVRASVSRNFRSCWDDGAILELLKMPHFAIAGQKDKHGDWVARWALWWDVEKQRILLNPVPYPHKYSALPDSIVALTSRVPIFSSTAESFSDGAERFRRVPFYTTNLFDEMESKSTGWCKKLSVAFDAMKSTEVAEVWP